MAEGDISLSLCDISFSPLRYYYIDCIGREFEVWELLSVLDHQKIVSKQKAFSFLITLSLYAPYVFFARIVKSDGDIMTIRFSADRLRKLHSVLATRDRI